MCWCAVKKLLTHSTILVGLWSRDYYFRFQSNIGPLILLLTLSSAWTRRSSALHNPRSASRACSLRITCLIVLSMSLTWFAFSTNRRFIWFNQPTRSIWKMLGPFATTSRLTPIHQVSPLYCRTPPAHRCPQRQRRQQQQRQRVTEGTAMAPWNGPNKTIVDNRRCPG